MKKTVVFTVILSFMLLVCTSCKGISAEKGSSVEKSDNGEKVLRGFITAFYTVNQSDYDYYEKMMKGFKDTEATGAAEAADYDKAYKTENMKFKPYLTDKSYVQFYNDRLSTGRIGNAYKKGNFVEVKDIKISKSSENEKEKTITYNFELQPIEKNKDTKKEEATKKSGTITVINDNGSWKILDEIPVNWIK